MVNQSITYRIFYEFLPIIEIDESKLIGNSNKVYYIFGVVYSHKNARLFYILNNKNKETLIPLIQKNVYTVNDIKVNACASK